MVAGPAPGDLVLAVVALARPHAAGGAVAVGSLFVVVFEDDPVRAQEGGERALLGGLGRLPQPVERGSDVLAQEGTRRERLGEAEVQGKLASIVGGHPRVDLLPDRLDLRLDVRKLGQEHGELAARAHEHDVGRQAEPLADQEPRRLDELAHEEGAGAQDAVHTLHLLAAEAEEGVLDAGEIAAQEAELRPAAVADGGAVAELAPGRVMREEAGGEGGDGEAVVEQRDVGLVLRRGRHAPPVALGEADHAFVQHRGALAQLVAELHPVSAERLGRLPVILGQLALVLLGRCDDGLRIRRQRAMEAGLRQRAIGKAHGRKDREERRAAVEVAGALVVVALGGRVLGFAVHARGEPVALGGDPAPFRPALRLVVPDRGIADVLAREAGRQPEPLVLQVVEEELGEEHVLVGVVLAGGGLGAERSLEVADPLR